MIRVVPPTDARLQFIADNMLPADRDELLAVRDKDAPLLDILQGCVAASYEAHVAEFDGVPFGVFGIAVPAPSPDDKVGVPWFISTGAMRGFRREFMRHSRAVLARWLTQHEDLYNVVDARHTVAIAWLRKLGFDVDMSKPAAHGNDGEPFYYFGIMQSV